MSKAQGPLAFEDFYAGVFGDRWPALRRALNQRERQVLRPAFSADASGGEVPWLPGALWFTPERAEMTLTRNPAGLLTYYVMDPTSVLAARALDARPGERVLDLCAAPGGKTLVLLETGARVVANEPSRARRDRLTQVIRQYATPEARTRVEVKGRDGERYGMAEPGAFDAVLVDAPCSGERHLLSHEDELAEWSEARSRRLAARQYALLASALLCLKPGGRLVYSTCALSPLENDAVVERLLSKKKDKVRVESDSTPPSPWAERTEHGWIHLPDRGGCGPLYFARLRRAPEGAAS
ncbi:MAG TPA: SAM-dependent methyltransferase [Bdellovibrionota bacterium]|nr:SAM-dependent methyltransferase [Bdellovibrionota bacterium]